jgi:hypothetical protein
MKDISDSHASWMSLRHSMTGAERNVDNPLFDNFIITYPYIDTLNDLKRYNRALRNSRRALEGAIPSTTGQSTSHAHLPRMSLPKFTGRCTDYTSFWNQFKAAVGDLTNISDAIKLSYLKTCLEGNPLSLIDSLPLTDASYQDAITLLTKKYANPDEIARHLHQSIKSLPTVKGGENFCADLTSLIDALEALCVQFKQQNH